MDNSGSLDHTEVESLLTEVIGVPLDSEYVRRMLIRLDAVTSDGVVSKAELLQAAKHDGIFQHMLKGIVTNHLPLAVRGCLNRNQDPLYCDITLRARQKGPDSAKVVSSAQRRPGRAHIFVDLTTV